MLQLLGVGTPLEPDELGEHDRDELALTLQCAATGANDFSEVLALKERRLSEADRQRFEGYLGEMFTALGLDIDTPATRDTPARHLQALLDITAGYEGDPKLVTAFPAEGTSPENDLLGQIIEGPIAFSALCEHHALPFVGVAHVGYIADQQIIGISKLTRLVRVFSRRFTVQERLGAALLLAVTLLVGLYPRVLLDVLTPSWRSPLMEVVTRRLGP